MRSATCCSWVANLARKLELDPEACLRHANEKFTRRFNAMERDFAGEARGLSELTLDQMEEGWQRVKATERVGLAWRRVDGPGSVGRKPWLQFDHDPRFSRAEAPIEWLTEASRRTASRAPKRIIALWLAGFGSNFSSHFLGRHCH